MKKLIIGVASSIVLDQADIATGKTIKLTIAGEEGTPLKDNANASIADVSLTYDSTLKKYKTAPITISTNEKPQYVRLYFYSSEIEIEHRYYPEDVRLEASSIGVEVEVVPVQYFIDYILAISSKMDLDYQEAVENYIHDRNSIRSALKAAEGNLEIDLEMFITPRTWTDKRDHFFERFATHFWQAQATYVPIISLDDVKIKFGQAEIADIKKEYFVWQRNEGLFEFVPLPGDGTLYSILLNNLSGAAMGILMGVNYDRIPCMFQFTYTTGLFHSEADSIEKEMIRRAVARRAYLEISNFIDPRKRNASESETTDGVTTAKTYKLDNVIKDLKDEEKKFIEKMQTKYAKSMDVVVI